MPGSFRVLSGGKAGAVFTPAGDSFVAGRHEAAELRFDRQEDTTVSARHARFQQSSGGWTVSDLGSRNGLLVNGRTVSGEIRLKPGDRVMFGLGGPEVEMLAAASVPESATARVRTAVRSERRRALIIGGAGVAMVLAVGLAFGVRSMDSRNAWESERRALEHRIDSLVADDSGRSTSLAAEVTGLSAALRQSRSELERLRAQLRSTPAGSDDADRLRAQVNSATAALRRQQLAAALDFGAIQRRARGAVAMLWVEFPDGRRVSGTAFAVRASGALLTNRHVVTGADGTARPSRIAVRFSDSDQAFPAHLVSVSPDRELALVQVENVIGDVPAVVLDERPDTLSPGSPVALIGYPLGGELEKDPSADRRRARPVVSAGLLVRTTPDVVEVQGLGAAGASGSPILDPAGNVIAVLYGGRDEQGTQVLVGVPAQTIVAFLSSARP